VTTAVVLVLEALAVGFVNWILGLAVRHQKMSLGGLGSDTMAAGSWAAGGLFAVFLLVCGVLVARMAATSRMPGRLGRIVLIVCAVVEGVVGTVVVGLVGWYAFAVLMVVLGLLVGTLVLYAPEDAGPPADAAAPPPPAPAGPPAAPPGAPATSTGP
jgi:MFS family permease